MALDIEKMTSLTSEGRQAVAEAFNALERWRIEIRAANARCLTEVLDQVSAAHRALGWPEQATNAAKEHFLRASSTQSQMIEEAMDLWQQQLEAQNWRSGAAGAMLQAPTTPSQFTHPASEMMRFGGMALTPFNLWIEVAQAWQRAWVSTIFGGTLPEPSMTSTRRTEASMREDRPSRS